MGLFDKVKQKLNIGGAKVILQLEQFTIANGATLPFKVQLQAGKLAQEVTAVTVTVKQRDEWTDRQGDGQRIQRFKTNTLAEKTDATRFTLQPGEQREFTFALPIQAVVAPGGTTGVMGTLSKLNDLVTQQKHTWTVTASVAIEGSMDPSASADIVVEI